MSNIILQAPAGTTGIVQTAYGNALVGSTGLVTVDSRVVGTLLNAGFVYPGNAPDAVNTAITTVGAGVLTAAAIAGGVISRTGSTAAYTDTTDTAAAIIAALQNANVGDSWKLEIRNTVAFPQTIAAGVGVTLSGQIIVPPNSVGHFLMTYSADGAVTMVGLYSEFLTSSALLSATALNTVGAGTITGAGIAGGITARGGSQSGSAFTDTTGTAAQIIAGRPNASIGDSWLYDYQNGTNALATLAGGSGVTVSGITKVPKNTTATYLVTYTAANTVTMVGLRTSEVSPQATEAAVATPDNGTTQTLTAAMISGANDVSHVSVGGTTPDLTLPLGSAMDTALPDMQIGQSYKLRVVNRNSGTATVVTNTGWTLTGTLTLATNTTRDFVVTKTGAATYTAVAVGTGTDS